MFGRRYKLFKLFGFAVHVDLSWIIIAVLVTWSLGAGLFPMYYPELATSTVWTMAVVGALGLFGSIIFHEMSHSLVARRYGLPIKGITLFVFGGVAEMDEEPQNAKTEFMMAIAGPISSLLISVVSFGLFGLGQSMGWPAPVQGVIGYLAWINLILVVFNMVPAFPLDGGRVLRSILWHFKGDLRLATRWASATGSFLGLVLMGLGVLAALYGNFLSGMWWLLIGWFIRQAAQMSYQQVLMRGALEGEPVRRFMQGRPVVVDSGTSLQEFVEDFVYRHQLKLFPVVSGGRLTGVVELKDVKQIPRGSWSGTPVGRVARSPDPDLTVSPDEDALKALNRMQRSQANRLLVVEGDQLVGVLSMRDLMQRLALQMELEPGPRRGGEGREPWSGGTPAGGRA